DPAGEANWREVQALLHEEIERLPERLRAPFLLCYLDGQSRAEAARQLGVTERTVWNRLAQARNRLQEVLARRGVELAAVLGAAALAGGSRAAVVPAAVVAATTRAALAF